MHYLNEIVTHKNLFLDTKQVPALNVVEICEVFDQLATAMYNAGVERLPETIESPTDNPNVSR